MHFENLKEYVLRKRREREDATNKLRERTMESASIFVDRAFRVFLVSRIAHVWLAAKNGRYHDARYG